MYTLTRPAGEIFAPAMRKIGCINRGDWLCGGLAALLSFIVYAWTAAPERDIARLRGIHHGGGALWRALTLRGIRSGRC